ncbi:MAG: DNA-methyltransferase [Candidatus Hodarchaeota archaeon]
MLLDTVLQGDCSVILPTLPRGTFDLIYVDPPYDIQQQFHSNLSKRIRELSYEHRIMPISSWFPTCISLLKETGTMFVSANNARYLWPHIEKQELPMPYEFITWWKPNSMSLKRKNSVFLNSEVILGYAKNPKKRKWKKMIPSDLLRFPVDSREFKDIREWFPYPKPQKLIELLVLNTTDERDIVLDPFFGSGTTGVVCREHSRHYVGIEINPVFIKKARHRISKIRPRKSLDGFFS